MFHRNLQLSSVLILSAIALPASAAVPFFNADCPGGVDVHADQGGPVYVQGRETQLKRFNDRYYEAKDSTSGITLSISSSDGGEPQVSYTGRNGANGICQVKSDGADGGQRSRHAHHDNPLQDDQASLPSEVTCESIDQRQVSCPMNTQGNVELVRRLSRAQCEQGQSWGLSRHSVWVSGGCRAEFRNPSRRSVNLPAAGNDAPLLGACNVRKGDQGALVTQVPVGADYQELIIDYPEGRFMCMVRNNGQVQSVTPLRRKQR